MSVALKNRPAACHNDIVVKLDGDTVFEPSTIGNLVAPFVDPRVGAVAGNARVADCDRLLARWQNIEYAVGFNIDRRVQDTWQAVTTVPGAVGAFRRSALQVGGVSARTLAEDTDLTIAIGRAGWRVDYDEQPDKRTGKPPQLPADEAALQALRDDFQASKSPRPSPETLKKIRAGYLGNLGFVDTCIGEVYKTLEDLNLIDNTIVVYTSDHGEMGGDHGGELPADHEGLGRQWTQGRLLLITKQRQPRDRPVHAQGLGIHQGELGRDRGAGTGDAGRDA